LVSAKPLSDLKGINTGSYLAINIGERLIYCEIYGEFLAPSQQSIELSGLRVKAEVAESKWNSAKSG
jgi:hypothetical protein